MPNTHRRYEILLPLKFNDGKPIPGGLIDKTLDELRTQFGALSLETQTIHGVEAYGKHDYDDLARVFVDVAEGADAREFFMQFKQQLKDRFQQWDIWITTYPIEII